VDRSLTATVACNEHVGLLLEVRLIVSMWNSGKRLRHGVDVVDDVVEPAGPARGCLRGRRG
jgi:hypothetical protein